MKRMKTFFTDYKNFTNTLTDENGSTSVLIVVMMIVLTAFGMAALTTAYAGYRLSERSVTFSEEFYQLEEQATEIQYELLEMSSSIYNDLLVLGEDIDLDNLYHEQLSEGLRNYAMEYEGMVIESDPSLVDDLVALVSYVVYEDKESGKAIGVKLSFQTPTSITEEYELIQIMNKYEWQEGVGAINEDLFFEDPFEESDDNNPFNELDEDKLNEQDEGLIDSEESEDNNPFNDLNED